MKAPDHRGWIGLGIYILCLVVFYMIAEYPELRKDEFFKALATIIVSSAFVNGVVQWAYGSTKAGGELASSNSQLVEHLVGTGRSVVPPVPPTLLDEQGTNGAEAQAVPDRI